MPILRSNWITGHGSEQDVVESKVAGRASARSMHDDLKGTC